MFAAPLLWFVEVLLVLEFAFSAHWTRGLHFCGSALVILCLLTTVLWFLGVVDIVYRSIRWREVNLRWYIPACVVNVLGLTVFFGWKGHVLIWRIISEVLSKLG